MTVIDANILLYAYNADAPQQAASARWLSDLLKSGETIALPLITIWAFIRISTNPRVWATPLSPKQAFATIREWLEQPGVAIVHPGQLHFELLESLVSEYGATGPLATDAALAAIAIENGASLASTDQDFSRFNGLRWINPLSKSKPAHLGIMKRQS